MVSTGTVLVLDPRDVVGHAIGVVSRFIEADERLERAARRRRRVRHGRLQMPDDARDEVAVPAVDPVDLFDQVAVRPHEP